MIAIDTNILVRLLTGDDEKQLNTVIKLLEIDSAWVSRTVCLELSWVLKSRYKIPPVEIAEAIKKLLETQNLLFEDEAEIEAAMDLVLEGMDVADAIHLCCVPSNISTFVTFDKNRIENASKLGLPAKAP